MQKTTFELRCKALRFKHFTNKGYALFACLGRSVVIGTLSIATLQHAKAEGMSVRTEAIGDTLQRKELKLDEVVVSGSRAPLTQSESAKIVSVITRDDIQRAAAESVNDVLKMATGVDVRQRGGFGVQTDISILGGTFDQIAILLNGVNISNPQTGHLSADFPVSLDDIVRIEVLEGASARVFGASAFNGAINIVTTGGVNNVATHGNEKRKMGGSLSLEGGMYGTFGASAKGGIVSKDKHNALWSNTLSGGYKQSDGGTRNSYFRKSQAFYQGSYDQSSIRLDWQLGMCTMNYGANTFYSAAYPNQYESNGRIFASVRGETKGKIHVVPTIYWNRSYDHFQLTKGSAAGENFHQTDVFGLSINAYTDWKLGRSSVGAEVRQEGILSTNLGKDLKESEYVTVFNHADKQYTRRDQRTDVSYFLEHNFLLKDFTASVGVVANMNTAYNSAFRFYPGVDISYRPFASYFKDKGGFMKVTASWNMGFRMPTFTDLYYKSPTHDGNQGLKPEKTQSLRIGAQFRSKGVEARISGFYDWGTDMIDWVMYSADDVYHSANFRLDNRGFEVNASFLPRELWEKNYISSVRVGYAFIDQQRHDNISIYKSNYAMEYLRHKFTAQIDHRIVSRLSASWQFRWQQRMGSYIVYENNKSTGVAKPYSPYGLLDVKLLWNAKKYELSLSMNNLTGHRYYDLGNVEQPGFWLMAGAKWKF